MIRNLFSRSEPVREAKALVPEATSVYAIGDIHGRLDLLEALQGKIVKDADKRPDDRHIVVYLGDYVDRGPESQGVVDFLLDDPLQDFERVYLLGNHEVFFLQFLEDIESARVWLMNGGAATCCSYGVDPTSAPEDGDALGWLQSEMQKAVPKAHRKFMSDLVLQHSEGDYLFVHAGIRPGVPLDAQDEDDILWIREPFLSSRKDFGKVVVHGHTPYNEPDVKFNRIGVDTGACFGGNLTALVLHEDTQRFLYV